ncbi:MAG TPA: HlyD family efflux transporter periplasmic adaptor subunit [Usitatibacter sp.]|nr:HlyD family efflux transporter periplasmic adaptor subunit [Usitatibacter sp.]
MKSGLLLLAGLLVAACAEKAPPALQGYVEGEFVRVAAPFAGTLVRLDVQRGGDVAADAPLFSLEAESEMAARREAEERMKRAQALADDLRRGLRASELDAVRAQLAQAEVAAGLSAKEHQRQVDLVARGFVSQQRADEARAALDRDRNRVAELRALLATARSGSRPDEIRAAEAEARAAQQALAQADWRLRQRSVTAIVPGIVTDTLFSRGEWVPAGAPVVTLLPPANVKIRFFVPEARLGEIRVGGKVALACSGCAAGLAATIAFVSPHAEYTPPVIYSNDSRTRLVFMVEAKPEHAGKLHPGQPVEVRLP